MRSFNLDGLDPAAAGQQSPPPQPDAALNGPYEGMEGEPEPFFAGRELYRALRGDNADDPLADELLWEGDFMSTQQDFVKKKQEDEMLERLERRMGEAEAGYSCWLAVPCAADADRYQHRWPQQPFVSGLPSAISAHTATVAAQRCCCVHAGTTQAALRSVQA